MNTQEKSLKLAELMGWKPKWNNMACEGVPKIFDYGFLEPYASGNNGRAQFAAILLKFPEVMGRHDLYMWNHPNGAAIGATEPTQANILDEILRMNGVDV